MLIFFPMQKYMGLCMHPSMNVCMMAVGGGIHLCLRVCGYEYPYFQNIKEINVSPGKSVLISVASVRTVPCAYTFPH